MSDDALAAAVPAATSENSTSWSCISVTPEARVILGGMGAAATRFPRAQSMSGGETVPQAERLTARVMLDDHVRVDDVHHRKRIPIR